MSAICLPSETAFTSIYCALRASVSKMPISIVAIGSPAFKITGRVVAVTGFSASHKFPGISFFCVTTELQFRPSVGVFVFQRLFFMCCFRCMPVCWWFVFANKNKPGLPKFKESIDVWSVLCKENSSALPILNVGLIW